MARRKKPPVHLVKVLLADDDLDALEGQKRHLSLDERTLVIGQATNVEEAVAGATNSKNKPDVVVLDMHFHGSKEMGISALEKIRRADPNIKVLARSADKGGDLVVRAMAAGANGYVWKGESRGGLADAVVRCYEGRLVVTKSVTAQVLAAVNRDMTIKSEDIYEQPEAREYIGLTPKLRRVAELYLEGLTADQIAKKLHYSVHTVRKYISKVHQILFGAQNRYQTFKRLTARDETEDQIWSEEEQCR